MEFCRPVLEERKVSVVGLCRSLVDPFRAYVYGTVINTFSDAMKVLTSV